MKRKGGKKIENGLDNLRFMFNRREGPELRFHVTRKLNVSGGCLLFQSRKKREENGLDNEAFCGQQSGGPEVRIHNIRKEDANRGCPPFLKKTKKKLKICEGQK